MQKIVTNLWFDTQAEEAARFYTSLFKNSSIDSINYYGPSGSEVAGMPENTVLTVAFTLEGQEYIAINGGPVFTFTPAISLMVNCANQQEVDRLWDAFCKEGEPGQCGWLTDKYGLSWQIVPEGLEKVLSNPDPVKAEKAMAAMLKMGKLSLAELEKAAEQA